MRDRRGREQAKIRVDMDRPHATCSIVERIRILEYLLHLLEVMIRRYGRYEGTEMRVLAWREQGIEKMAHGQCIALYHSFAYIKGVPGCFFATKFLISVSAAIHGRKLATRSVMMSECINQLLCLVGFTRVRPASLATGHLNRFTVPEYSTLVCRTTPEIAGNKRPR